MHINKRIAAGSVASFGLLAVSSALFFSSDPASAQFGVCNYIPRDANSLALPKVNHTTGGGTLDVYVISGPDVKRPVTRYPQIRLKARDRFKIAACGCVQTGGAGKTWKSYVNPKGRNSDRLYSGTIQLLYDGSVPPPSFWQNPTNMMRIGKWIQNQGPGISIPNGRSATLLFGYQDDGYGDNGYWGHDDGNDDQCRGVGIASIQVTIFHNSF